MLADPHAGLRKPFTDLLFLRYRTALDGTNAIFASTFLASTGSPAVAGSHVAVSLAALGLTAVGRRVIEGFHDPPLGDVVLAIETAGRRCVAGLQRCALPTRQPERAPLPH